MDTSARYFRAGDAAKAAVVERILRAVTTSSATSDYTGRRQDSAVFRDFKESTGKCKGTGPRAWQPVPGEAFGEAAVIAGKTDTFLAECYRRIAWRRGKNTAIVGRRPVHAVIIWHLLSDPEVHFIDLGPDFYDKRIDTERKKRTISRQLEALATVSCSNPQPDASTQQARQLTPTRLRSRSAGTEARRPRHDFRMVVSINDLDSTSSTRKVSPARTTTM